MKRCPRCNNECLDQAIKCPRCKFDLTKDISIETKFQSKNRPYVQGFPILNNTISIIHELKKANKKLIITNIVVVLSIVGISFYGVFKLNAVDSQVKTTAEKHVKLDAKSNELFADYNNLSNEIPDFKSENTEQLDFLNKYIVFVKKEEEIYHKLDCEDFKGTKSYEAYNISAAKTHLFKPCPKCIKNDE